VALPVASPSLAGALRLREIRRFVRRSRSLPLVAFVAVAYALGSMLEGGMLALFPIHGGTTVELLTGSGTGQAWWDYPGLLVVAPWGVLSLPFFPTIAMIVVSVGVGLGMAVAGGLIVRLLRPSPKELARSKAIGAATGLTPAMISLVTLGSCCTTTAVATGGIGLLAQASGTSTSNLLLNNWYLGVAQVVIVWAALVGQELLLVVYGGLLGVAPGAAGPDPAPAPPLDRRWFAGAALRVALAVGGILWSLSMLAEWTTHAPLASGAGWWFRWTVQHQLLAGFAIAAAFFPARVAAGVERLAHGWARAAAALLGIAAVSLLVWLPPPLPAWGLDSLGSQLAGALGAPAAWGAIPPGSVTGWALAVRWLIEYALPAGLVLAALTYRERAFALLLPTAAGPGPASVSTEAAGASRAALARGSPWRARVPEPIPATPAPPESP
jgi:hypothetical protein